MRTSGPNLDSEWPETLIHRLDVVVRNHGYNIAIKDGTGKAATYKQMDDRINSIAVSMLAAGVENNSKVAVFQEPTSDWVCSVLAILRIGAIYVPLDLRIPTVRLAAIVSDCQPHSILCHAPTTKDTPALMSGKAKIINISLFPEFVSASIPNMASSDSPAAILYTSGSTGIPKGIILKHSSLRNQIIAYAKEFHFGSETVLQQTAYSFDMSLWQLFIAISYGGAVYVVPKEMRGDSQALTELIAAEHITFTCATPSEYVAWFRYGVSKCMQESEWKIAFSGGESITEVLTHEFRALGKPQLRLINCYGPTEITCSSNSFEVPYMIDDSHLKPLQDRAPAGFTLPNYAVYILDENMKPVPANIPGEIVVGGAGVASGYLNNEELTRLKFIPDTFASEEFLSMGWTTMHRTGDRGRLRSDGALLYDGRINGDTQIKLRGVRIDLNDVSSSLIQAADGVLSDAVISVRGIKEQFLVAFVIFTQNRTSSDPSTYIRKLLANSSLPSYMRPALAVPLDNLPMTVNGKLDRKALDDLPLPQNHGSDQGTYMTATEQRLRQIWTSVLPETSNRLDISRESDFFSVGGNSLLLMQVQSGIRDAFNVNLTLMELFHTNTLESMASKLDIGKASEQVQIDWESETQFASELLSSYITSETALVNVSPKVVVLTGSTGFLGKAILHELVKSTTVEKIHCIAMRQNHDRKSPTSSPKVVMHSGDLKLPRLGLSEEDASTVFEEADAIIHNGADVSFLKTYHTLKQANVESTKELVKLCLARRIPIHYISTTGIGHMTNKDTFDEASASAYQPPTNGSNGYIATKWASERYLEKTNQQFGLPIRLHRPSSITGEDAPAFDIIHNLVKYSRLMKAVPISDRWHGYLDFISVESVASGVVDEVVSKGSGSIEYLHHCGALVVPITGMKEFLEGESGSSFTALALSEWAERAVGFGLDRMVAAYLDTLKGSITFPRLVRSRKALSD